MNKIILSLIIVGTVTNSSILYSQCITGDCINGSGTKVYPSGSKYTGQFKDGKEHGRGTFYFFNGTRYEGEFENGNFHGKGTVNYATGAESQGTFSNGTLTSPLEKIEPKETPEYTDIISLLPRNLDFMIKFSSLNSLYRNFSVRANSIYGQRVHAAKKISKKAGFNPLSIWDLKNIGIDTSRELGFAVTNIRLRNDKVNDTPDMDIVLFVPVINPVKFMVSLYDKLKEHSRDITITKIPSGIMLESKGKKEKIYISSKGNYVFLGINTSGKTESFIKSIDDGPGHLDKTKTYLRMKKIIDPRSDVFAYFDISNFIKNNDPVIRQFFSKTMQYEKKAMDSTLQTFKDYEGAGFSMDLENADFQIKTAYIVRENSRVMDLMKGIRYNKTSILGIDKQPLLLFLFGVNIKMYYSYLMNSWPEKFSRGIQDSFRNIKKEYNIDVVSEVLNNLGETLTLGFMKGRASIYSISTPSCHSR